MRISDWSSDLCSSVLIAQHRRVGEIALPTRDRQLLGEMLKDGVGDAEVAFGILEVDRVDLVWHRRAANFAGNGALLEVADRDIAPEIAAEDDRKSVV